MVGAHHQINNVFTMDSYFQLELTIENSQLCRDINERIYFFSFYKLKVTTNISFRIHYLCSRIKTL